MPKKKKKSTAAVVAAQVPPKYAGGSTAGTIPTTGTGQAWCKNTLEKYTSTFRKHPLVHHREDGDVRWRCMHCALELDKWPVMLMHLQTTGHQQNLTAAMAREPSAGVGAALRVIYNARTECPPMLRRIYAANITRSGDLNASMVQTWRGFAARAVPDPAQPDPLPSGWMWGRTAKGNIYYLHEATKTTQWAHPHDTGGCAVNAPPAGNGGAAAAS